MRYVARRINSINRPLASGSIRVIDNITPMKTYRVSFHRSQYGYVDITAESKEKAEEIVGNCEHDDRDENIKGGDFEVVEVEEVESTKTFTSIKIHVKGGVVVDVENVPAGYDYEVVDADEPRE